MATVRGKVLRKLSTPYGTPGRLALDNGYLSDTQELAWHGNARGVSCTLPAPGGAPEVYRGRVWRSPTLGRLVVRFADAHGRKDCLIHNGNFAADAVDIDGDGVPEVTQVHGCTEVGDGFGEVLRRDGKTQHGILGSVKALERLIKSLENSSEHATDEYGFVSGYDDVEVEYSWSAE